MPDIDPLAFGNVRDDRAVALFCAEATLWLPVMVQREQGDGPPA
jgi:hypothetical protein